MRIITVVPYSPEWPGLFEAEAALLRQTLGDCVLQIHHIGSTSVPGLDAKPVIDILLEVTSLSDLDDLNDRMAALGYPNWGELGIPRRRYFPKGGDQRTHQIHAFEAGDEHVWRHLAFRDYLRTHTDVARDYAQLKTAVAQSCDNDIERYCAGKDAWIKRVEALALAKVNEALRDSQS